MSTSELLEAVKSQSWFYEFPLPDGSVTSSYLDPSFRPIHLTRERLLGSVLANYVGAKDSALDVACHEGYYSAILSRHFKFVHGIDRCQTSLTKAGQILKLLSCANVSLGEGRAENFASQAGFDFVLCYGLLYHHENPIGLLRNLSSLTRDTLCLETQLTSVDISGSIEDGGFMNQRRINGFFALCDDYPASAEGGTTDVALVPSASSLVYLLRHFGFSTVDFSDVPPGEYEQFTRRQRVVITAKK